MKFDESKGLRREQTARGASVAVRGAETCGWTHGEV